MIADLVGFTREDVVIHLGVYRCEVEEVGL